MPRVLFPSLTLSSSNNPILHLTTTTNKTNGLRQRKSLRRNRHGRNRPVRRQNPLHQRRLPLARRHKPRLSQKRSLPARPLRAIIHPQNPHHRPRHLQLNRRHRLDQENNSALRPAGRRSKHGRCNRAQPRRRETDRHKR